jgi:hypothetical protein
MLIFLLITPSPPFIAPAAPADRIRNRDGQGYNPQTNPLPISSKPPYTISKQNFVKKVTKYSCSILHKLKVRFYNNH